MYIAPPPKFDDVALFPVKLELVIITFLQDSKQSPDPTVPILSINSDSSTINRSHAKSEDAE